MTVVILAAGYATRLYPLTLNKPKCLLEVAGTSILDTLCAKLEGLKTLDQVVVVTNAKFFTQLEVWNKKKKYIFPVRILNDRTTSNETRLGAIGDLEFAIDSCRIDDDILMMASDNLFEASLMDFVAFAGTKGQAVCVGLYDIGDPRLAANKFGVFEVDKSWQVTKLEEKPKNPKSSLIGVGVYYFPRITLKLVNDYLNDPEAKDAPGYYINWLLRKTTVYVSLFKGMWYDSGDLIL